MNQNLSVVIPVFNSEKTIERLVEEILNCLDDRVFEIVLVNDASRDGSEAICQKLCEAHSRVKFISLRRNFGEHNATMCGLNYVEGEYAVILDDDFQNPPSEIIKLLTEAERGYDVVYSCYAKKKHSPFRNFVSSLNDQVATVLLNKPPDLYLSSFKVIAAPVIREITKYRGPFPYVDGLVLRVTDNISRVEVEHQDRHEGRSNYTLKKLLSLHLNMFFNFSVTPLRIATLIGVSLFVLGFFLSMLFIIEKFLDPSIPLGWTSLATSLFMLCGLQMVFLGVIGEYLGKQYLDQNGSPQWVIKREESRGIQALETD